MLKIPSQLEVAEQHLETAIDLYFFDGSVVVVHTLACISHEILDKECARLGLERGIVEESLKKFIKPEKRKEVLDGINGIKNYFKHGRYNRGVKPTWNPDMSQYFLFDACALYNRLTSNKFPSRKIFTFSLWFRMTRGEMFQRHENFDLLLDSLRPLLSGKKDFYELALSLPDDLGGALRETPDVS